MIINFLLQNFGYTHYLIREKLVIVGCQLLLIKKYTFDYAEFCQNIYDDFLFSVVKWRVQFFRRKFFFIIVKICCSVQCVGNNNLCFYKFFQNRIIKYILNFVLWNIFYKVTFYNKHFRRKQYYSQQHSIKIMKNVLLMYVCNVRVFSYKKIKKKYEKFFKIIIFTRIMLK